MCSYPLGRTDPLPMAVGRGSCSCTPGQRCEGTAEVVVVVGAVWLPLAPLVVVVVALVAVVLVVMMVMLGLVPLGMSGVMLMGMTGVMLMGMLMMIVVRGGVTIRLPVSDQLGL